MNASSERRVQADRIKVEVEGNSKELKTECEIKICFRDLIGSEHHLQLLSCTKVLNLKDVVFRLWTIPPIFQRLLVGERTLEDSEALSDYSNLSDIPNAVLVLVMVCADAVNAALSKLSNGCSEKDALEVLNHLGTLGKRTGAGVVKTVALLLGDSNHSIRQAAHKTLVKIARRGHRDAFETLSEALQEPSTRDATVTALKLIAEAGDEDAIMVMTSCLQSHGEREAGRWWTVVDGGGRRTGGMESETVVEFISQAEYTHDHDFRIRQALERAGYDSERLEEYKFFGALLFFSRYADPPGQTILCEGEWRVGEPMRRPQHRFDHSAFPLTFILTFLQEKNVEVCVAALDVLGHVAGKGNQMAIAAVASCLENESNVEVCLAALDALGRVAGTGNHMAIAAVASCLEDESDDVLWKAVEQLGLVIKAGDHRSILHAKKRLTHEDRRVRWAAQEALGQFMEKSD